MKYYLPILVSFIFLSKAFGQEVYQRHLSPMEFNPLSFFQIEILNNYGEVIINPSKGDLITLNVVFEVTAMSEKVASERFSKMGIYVFSQNGQIRIQGGGNVPSEWKTKQQLKLHIGIPKGVNIPIAITQHYGHSSINVPTRFLTIEQSFGNILFSENATNVEIENNFGAIDGKGFKGGSIKIKNGEFQCTRIEDIKIRGEFCNGAIEEVLGGEMQLKNGDWKIQKGDKVNITGSGIELKLNILGSRSNIIKTKYSSMIIKSFVAGSTIMDCFKTKIGLNLSQVQPFSLEVEQKLGTFLIDPSFKFNYILNTDKGIKGYNKVNDGACSIKIKGSYNSIDLRSL